MVHLRFDGTSREATLPALGIQNDSNDAILLSAVAEHFDVSLTRLQADSIIDRGTDGDIVIRPKAVYG